MNLTGNVNIYCAGDVLITGRSQLNAGGCPAKLTLFVDKSADSLTASTVTVNVESKLETLVYAPYSLIQFDGQGGGTGNFFAAKVQLNGQATVSVSTASTI